MTEENKIQICPYCKNEIRIMDNHAIRIEADSPNEKRFIKVICQLNRYYFVEPIEQK